MLHTPNNNLKKNLDWFENSDLHEINKTVFNKPNSNKKLYKPVNGKRQKLFHVRKENVKFNLQNTQPPSNFQNQNRNYNNRNNELQNTYIPKGRRPIIQKKDINKKNYEMVQRKESNKRQLNIQTYFSSQKSTSSSNSQKKNQKRKRKKNVENRNNSNSNNLINLITPSPNRKEKVDERPPFVFKSDRNNNFNRSSISRINNNNIQLIKPQQEESNKTPQTHFYFSPTSTSTSTSRISQESLKEIIKKDKSFIANAINFYEYILNENPEIVTDEILEKKKVLENEKFELFKLHKNASITTPKPKPKPKPKNTNDKINQKIDFFNQPVNVEKKEEKIIEKKFFVENEREQIIEKKSFFNDNDDNDERKEFQFEREIDEDEKMKEKNNNFNFDMSLIMQVQENQNIGYNYEVERGGEKPQIKKIELTKNDERLLENKNYGSNEYSWSDSVKGTADKTFGIKKFRPNQKECINAACGGKDIMLLMPTGGGKSLCFQVPGAFSSGLTIVISPLLSLIQDQVSALKSKNVQATYICGSTPYETQNEILRELTQKEMTLRFLYLTPEKINQNNNVKNKLWTCYKNNNLTRFVIDEAHCVSTWGHNFRPDYANLGFLRERYTQIPIMALTATATKSVQDDIRKILRFDVKNQEFFKGSFNRPNLRFDVLPKAGKFKKQSEDISKFINKLYKGKSGIIYCLSKNDCSKLSGELNELGHKTDYYHSGRTTEEKTVIHRQWANDEIHVIIATIAFGMGIDKPDVRFVIHHSMPQSLEGYFQESGRSGRDGSPSHCVLFYRYGDKIRLWRLQTGEQDYVVNTRDVKNKLYKVEEYCTDNSLCRRKLLLNHLGQQYTDCSQDPLNQRCDNCRYKGTLKRIKVLSVAREIVNCIQEVGNFVEAKGTIAKILKGSKGQIMKKRGRDKLKSYGRCSSHSINDIQKVMMYLVFKEYLFEDIKSIKVRGQNYPNEFVVFGIGNKPLPKNELYIDVKRGKKNDVYDFSEFKVEKRFKKLRRALEENRLRVSRLLNMQKHFIYSDTGIDRLVKICPKELSELLKIEGFGVEKIIKSPEIGLSVIRIIKNWCARRGKCEIFNEVDDVTAFENQLKFISDEVMKSREYMKPTMVNMSQRDNSISEMERNRPRRNMSTNPNWNNSRNSQRNMNFVPNNQNSQRINTFQQPRMNSPNYGASQINSNRRDKNNRNINQYRSPPFQNSQNFNNRFENKNSIRNTQPMLNNNNNFRNERRIDMGRNNNFGRNNFEQGNTYNNRGNNNNNNIGRNNNNFGNNNKERNNYNNNNNIERGNNNLPLKNNKDKMNENDESEEEEVKIIKKKKKKMKKKIKKVKKVHDSSSEEEEEEEDDDEFDSIFNPKDEKKKKVNEEEEVDSCDELFDFNDDDNNNIIQSGGTNNIIHSYDESKIKIKNI